MFRPSSTNTVAVALDVAPVMVSPFTNKPVVPVPVSVTILLPSSCKINSNVLVCCLKYSNSPV